MSADRDGFTSTLRMWTSKLAAVHRNIFAIETENGFVVVDAPLLRSEAIEVREWLSSLGKPVLGVLITHAHPDHNFGLTAMLGNNHVPIIATAAVIEGIRATEDLMQSLVAINFPQSEIESDRLFPNVVARPEEPVIIDAVHFRVTDWGARESAADSVWTSPALPGAVFAGDLVMSRTHLAFIQGNSAGYLDAVRQLSAEAAPGSVFFPGHGGLVPVSATGRQISYIEAYRCNVSELAQGRPELDDAAKAELIRRMMVVEPSPVLAMHITMGADSIARELVTTG